VPRSTVAVPFSEALIAVRRRDRLVNEREVAIDGVHLGRKPFDQPRAQSVVVIYCPQG
jgi:hypothetical protein